MKVMVKEPGKRGVIMEVGGIAEINKIVGNLNDDGSGSELPGSDRRTPIGNEVDMYCNDFAITNQQLPANLWTDNGMNILHGNLVFAGYNREQRADAGACSLTEAQIKFVQDFISLNTL